MFFPQLVLFFKVFTFGTISLPNKILKTCFSLTSWQFSTNLERDLQVQENNKTLSPLRKSRIKKIFKNFKC